MTRIIISITMLYPFSENPFFINFCSKFFSNLSTLSLIKIETIAINKRKATMEINAIKNIPNGAMLLRSKLM